MFRKGTSYVWLAKTASGPIPDRSNAPIGHITLRPSRSARHSKTEILRHGELGIPHFQKDGHTDSSPFEIYLIVREPICQAARS